MPSVRILTAYGLPNSARGVPPTIVWRNDSGKTIKYITFTAVPYNAVGDIVACTITKQTSIDLKITGPIETFNNDKDIKYSDFYYDKSIPMVNADREGRYYIEHWSGTKYFLKDEDYENVFNITSKWEPAWYNNSIQKISITNVSIIYMDGSTEEISNPPIWNFIWRN